MSITKYHILGEGGEKDVYSTIQSEYFQLYICFNNKGKLRIRDPNFVRGRRRKQCLFKETRLAPYTTRRRGPRGVSLPSSGHIVSYSSLYNSQWRLGFKSNNGRPYRAGTRDSRNAFIDRPDCFQFIKIKFKDQKLLPHRTRIELMERLKRIQHDHNRKEQRHRLRHPHGSSSNSTTSSTSSFSFLNSGGASKFYVDRRTRKLLSRTNSTNLWEQKFFHRLRLMLKRNPKR